MVVVDVALGQEFKGLQMIVPILALADPQELGGEGGGVTQLEG